MNIILTFTCAHLQEWTKVMEISRTALYLTVFLCWSQHHIQFSIHWQVAGSAYLCICHRPLPADYNNGRLHIRVGVPNSDRRNRSHPHLNCKLCTLLDSLVVALVTCNIYHCYSLRFQPQNIHDFNRKTDWFVSQLKKEKPRTVGPYNSHSTAAAHDVRSSSSGLNHWYIQ